MAARAPPEAVLRLRINDDELGFTYIPGMPIWTLVNEFIKGFGAAVSAARPRGVLTSWYRSPSENAGVSGARLSQHLVGLAADVVVDDPARFARALEREGMTVIQGASHLHVHMLPVGSDIFHRTLDALSRGSPAIAERLRR